ncbi:MAG: IclR family transcriptional regulator [Nostocoides sp.]
MPDTTERAWAASTPRKRSPEECEDASAIKSVASALDVLECFATDGDLGVSDVARRLGIAKSTAHRALATMASRGFVEQDEQTGLYRLGLHIYELGQLAQARNTIRHAALPIMRQLAGQTGQTVNLGVPDGADVVFVERLEFGPGGQILSHAGRRFPAHTTSSGKVIAAFNPLVLQARLRAGFPPRVSHTIRTSEEFLTVIDKVRRDGYAISVGESFDGATSVATPVLRHGVAVASISSFGLSDVLDPQVSRIVPLLRSAATRIAHAIPHDAQGARS